MCSIINSHQTIYKSPKICPKGKDMDGIFDYFIKKKIDPITSFVTVKVAESFSTTDPTSVIYWKNGNGRWASNNSVITDKEQYYALDFGTNSLIMTHFSFKGYYDYGFATIFDLYGLKGFDEWKRIQTFNSKDYCNKTLINGVMHCGEENVETWKLDTPGYYNAYKWVLVEGSDPEKSSHLSMQGIDIFGQLNPNVCFENTKDLMLFSITNGLLFIFILY